jgi:hypothetical protein
LRSCRGKGERPRATATASSLIGLTTRRATKLPSAGGKDQEADEKGEEHRIHDQLDLLVIAFVVDHGIGTGGIDARQHVQADAVDVDFAHAFRQAAQRQRDGIAAVEAQSGRQVDRETGGLARQRPLRDLGQAVVDQVHLDAFDRHRRNDGKEQRQHDAEGNKGDDDAPAQGIPRAHREAPGGSRHRER